MEYRFYPTLSVTYSVLGFVVEFQLSGVEAMTRVGLDLLKAFQYLHSECEVGHTEVSPKTEHAAIAAKRYGHSSQHT